VGPAAAIKITEAEQPVARDDLTFQLDSIALAEALLCDDGDAYDAVLDADDSTERLRELVAGAVGGWCALLESACGPCRCCRQSGTTS
jgi:hypothetical protein